MPFLFFFLGYVWSTAGILHPHTTYCTFDIYLRTRVLQWRVIPPIKHHSPVDLTAAPRLSTKEVGFSQLAFRVSTLYMYVSTNTKKSRPLIVHGLKRGGNLGTFIIVNHAIIVHPCVKTINQWYKRASHIKLLCILWYNHISSHRYVTRLEIYELTCAFQGWSCYQLSEADSYLRGPEIREWRKITQPNFCESIDACYIGTSGFLVQDRGWIEWN